MQTVQELGLNWNKKNEDRVYNLAHLVSEAHSEVYKKYFFRGKDIGQVLTNHESNIANEVIMHFVKKDKLIYKEKDNQFNLSISLSRTKKYVFLQSSKTESNETWFLDSY